MTDITHSTLVTWFQSLKHKTAAVSVEGSHLRLEERDGSHLGKTTFVHPGSDTMRNTILDVQAIGKDNGIAVRDESTGSDPYRPGECAFTETEWRNA